MKTITIEGKEYRLKDEIGGYSRTSFCCKTYVALYDSIEPDPRNGLEEIAAMLCVQCKHRMVRELRGEEHMCPPPYEYKEL